MMTNKEVIVKEVLGDESDVQSYKKERADLQRLLIVLNNQLRDLLDQQEAHENKHGGPNDNLAFLINRKRREIAQAKRKIKSPNTKSTSGASEMATRVVKEANEQQKKVIMEVSVTANDTAIDDACLSRMMLKQQIVAGDDEILAKKTI